MKKYKKEENPFMKPRKAPLVDSSDNTSNNKSTNNNSSILNSSFIQKEQFQNNIEENLETPELNIFIKSTRINPIKKK